MADGIVDEDHHELAEAGRIAAELGRLRVDEHLHTAFRGRPRERRRRGRRDVAQVDRDALERDGPGVGAGQQQQVIDHRRQVVDLVADVGQGAAHARHRLRCMAAQVVHAGPDHGQRGPQLVRRIGGEFPLAAQRLPLVDEGPADRDQGALRVRRPDARGREQRHEPADDEDDDEDPEGALLRGPVADDLEEVGLTTELDGIRQDADRGGQHGLLDLAGRDRRRLDVGHVPR